jgi:putative methyltransferase (TIGR04325 family)
VETAPAQLGAARVEGSRVNARTLMKGLVPPLLLDQVRRWSGRTLRFGGHPADWAEALRMSSGYAASNIIERVTQATRAVVSGAAHYERDSVLFDEPEHPFAVLAALWRAAAGHGSLDVVDFGGSLGSSYRQCRPLLEGLSAVRWRIVEQPSFVAAGRREFTTEELGFFDTLSELPAPAAPRVVLASSVLQYLENPHAVLDAFAAVGASHLVIDRTLMCDQPNDRLCIQHVPAQIYAASYPCRLLSRPRLLERLDRHWKLRCDFSCAEGRRTTEDGFPFEYRGLMLDRRP